MLRNTVDRGFFLLGLVWFSDTSAIFKNDTIGELQFSSGKNWGVLGASLPHTCGKEAWPQGNWIRLNRRQLGPSLPLHLWKGGPQKWRGSLQIAQTTEGGQEKARAETSPKEGKSESLSLRAGWLL